jgi:glycosyltransferase involved in cell wall biosynthesis
VTSWHIITSEYPPQVGGVSDYTQRVAEGLAEAGDEVHVWCPPRCTSTANNSVIIHPTCGAFAPRDLREIDRLLDRFAPPRRLLVQWVPHGFGYHSMNVPFCLWVRTRARDGDWVELMVHEPFLEFGKGPLHHAVMASVHRFMTLVLLGAAARVWIATPAWESYLRPYALGRRVPFAWLPIPSCVGSCPPEGLSSELRQRYLPNGGALVGHFGTSGPAVLALLDERLPLILKSARRPSLLLIGTDTDRFRERLVDRYPALSDRVHAAGHVPSSDLGAYLDACDLFVQPYPDGVTSRRTSTMACLSHGRAIVTTRGHLTEAFWSDSGAVALADLDDPLGFTRRVERLLADEAERQRLGARARALYDARFALRHTITALRSARVA